MKPQQDKYDFVILGAGIVGLSIAKELRIRNPDATILLVEKEGGLGVHASGRNSGVLHSGIYYPTESVKAKVCVSGARSMATYCDQNELPIKRIGKVIVPTSLEDDKQINLLYERAVANGSRVFKLDEQALKEIEPEAYTTGRALYSPDTAVIDPLAILRHLSAMLENSGVEIAYDAKCTGAAPDRAAASINGRRIQYGHLYNATGQYADQMAKLFGVGNEYTLIPFKGYYYRLKDDSGIKINGLIYPVPNLNVPFLGVHSVSTISGKTYFGPSALPALGRENYHGLEGFDPAEVLQILKCIFHQYISNNQGFRKLMHEELARLQPHNFVASAKRLVPNLTRHSLVPSRKVGIRPQLVDLNRRELVMDFLVKRRENTTHVLNAISPAFTSAFSFASMVVDS